MRAIALLVRAIALTAGAAVLVLGGWMLRGYYEDPTVRPEETRRLALLSADPALKLVPPATTSIENSSARCPERGVNSALRAVRVFRSAASWADIVAFYGDKLPDLGWKAEWAKVPGVSGSVASQTYNKPYDGWTASVTILWYEGSQISKAYPHLGNLELIVESEMTC